MITVLITGAAMHSVDLIDALRSNSDGEKIRAIGVNCEESALPRKSLDKGYVVHRIEDPFYVEELKLICIEEHVDVILPFITAELPLAAKIRDSFEKIGVHVSVSSLESIEKAGNKVWLANHFPGLMPKQIIAESMEEMEAFLKEVGYPEKNVCCKLPNRCGGLGFAVIDEQKGKDLTIFNKFGMNRYITWEMFLVYWQNRNGEEIILQEYEEGTDYSLCVLADHGKITHELGFEADLMSYGSAMHARIRMNVNAMEIAREIVAETGLDGNACFDFMLKPDGYVKLLEVNPRISATLPFMAKAGMNLPYLRVKQLMGHDIRNEHPVVNYDLKMSKNYESEYFV